MDRIIGVTELQRKFRTVFDEVARKHTPYILTRGSRPEAVLIPYDHYIRLMRADEAGVLKRFEALRDQMAHQNEKYSEAEVEADLREATKVIRSRKRK
jgi:prevent-host-death family protein